MRSIAEASGTGLVEDGDKVYVVDRGMFHLFTMRYVMGLICFIALANFVISIFLGAPTVLFLILAGLVIGSGVGLWWALGEIKKRRALMPPEADVVCVFDRMTGSILDKNGVVLGRIDEAKLGFGFQLTSSGRRLMLSLPNEEILLVRGTPLGGGVFAVKRVLEAEFGLGA